MGVVMHRKVFDILVSTGGLILVAVLVVAGALLMWGHGFASSTVHNELAQQDIYFAPKGSSDLANPIRGRYLDQYAGQQVLSGPQAEAYANHQILVDLDSMPYHGVYAKIAEASLAHPNNAELASLVQTSFRGTTLRALLLTAYAFWTFGQIALWAAIASFVVAGLLALLVALGLWHSRRVPQGAEILSRMAT
jgi:hypothetical protein